MKGYKLSKYVEKVFETPSDEFSEWFGYYNYDALNSDHSRLLCNRIREDGVQPRADLKVEIGYYDITTGEWHHIGESDSWNWQQGCMAQWLNDNEIIYNSSENNHHISIIHNIKLGTDRKIDWAIYGIMPNGRKSITLDMERAHWCRAYHYESVVDVSKEGAIYEKDGVFEVDLVNNTCKRIISIQDIIAIDSRPYFSKAKHWLEHVMINPKGTKFCVLHRFSPIDDVYRYITRIIIVDIATLTMECIPGWETTQWSHFGWDGDNFVIYTYPKKIAVSEKDFVVGGGKTILYKQTKLSLKTKIVNIIRNVFPEKWERKLRGTETFYQYYSYEKGHYELSELYKNSEFLTDGHPSFDIAYNRMVTDTYPNRNKIQYLYLLDREHNKVRQLGEFYAYYKGNPASCDLHPKLSRDGCLVVVDSAHDNRHHMLVLKIINI